MSTMGKYCKAYPVKRLHEFSQWTEHSDNTRKKTKDIDGTAVEVNRQLTDDDILYVQENYVVTDGIFQDENIIFDQITPEWKEFCHTVLEFEVPDYASRTVNEPVGTSAAP